jgi:AraC-like DNA-binding protein
VTTTDAYRRILDLAQAGLDDPSLGADELAGRAHLSRFHFDRLVTATGGEPPGSLRRRLLLERSAFRLLHGPHGDRGAPTVLDIAVEAGYGSHEAFTRAFTRAYGRSPTAVRADPPPTFRDLELPGASGVHFQPPGGLRLPAHLSGAPQMTGNDVLQQLVDHHVDSLTGLLERAATLDEATLDGPLPTPIETIDGSPEQPPTLRDVLNNLVTQEEHWISALRGGAWPDETDRSTAGLAARHSVAGRDYRAFVAGALAEGTLGDTFVDTTCEPPQTHTLGGTIAHVVTFGAVRRTTVAGALETAGMSDVGHLADPRPWIDALGRGRETRG